MIPEPPTTTPSRRWLVGQPLLYAMSVFASIGVFLVCPRFFSPMAPSLSCSPSSSAMTKGNCCYTIRTLPVFRLKSFILRSVMSGIITGPYFKSYFNQPKSLEVGTMVAVLEIGAFGTSCFFPWPSFHPDVANQVTSLAAGRIGDVIGRKRTLFYGAVVFTIGGAIQTLSVGFWSMVLGRIVSGCGVGLLSCVFLCHRFAFHDPLSLFSCIVPIYQSEISPPNHVRLHDTRLIAPY